MAFAGGDTDNLKFILTQLGQKTLAKKGLEKEILYYTLWDGEVNYLVNTIPNLMMDISGSKNSVVPNSITFKDNLR